MRAARQERFDFLCGYRGSNAYQAYCDRGSGKLQLSAVSQHNPGFMCAKRGQVMMSGRGTDSNTNWKQTKCGDGFYCSKGVRAPCDTCPAEMYGRKSCTPKQNRVCAPCARQCKDSSTQAYFEKSSCTLDTPRVCAACRKPCAKGEYQAEACSNSSTRQCTANRVLLFQGRGAARQLFFPRPIPPSFLVLARARLWCLGAPIRVLTSLRA